MRLLGVIVLVFAIAAAPASAGTIRVGIAANGKTVRAHPGDVIVVTLASNASTGYSWEVAALDLRVARVAGAEYVAPPQSNPPKVGAPGNYVLTLRVRAEGKTALRLEYVGPGRDAPVGRKYRVTLVVS